ncbi:hypothetical protein ML462_03590 [Gramella lutea]|uniref:Uncharacterized protein n=1 Tax=Christiangramia lutea TaxID=1607951 RepID=A0A9X1V0W2_9FLAO|nr:hypothetical protein [Christiangramia lutea]MCH4822247.1 hypothetical protein [Christiangramia lutea]
MNENIEEKDRTEVQNKNHEAKELPLLYSKRLILLFSGLFSILFGAVLMLSNLRKLGERKAYFQVLTFVIIYVTGLVYTLSSIKGGTNFSLPLNLLGGFILTEYFWNGYIGKETEYQKKSWVKPALISLCISVPAFLALVYFG